MGCWNGFRCAFSGGENFQCVGKWREFAHGCFCAAVCAVWVWEHFCASLLLFVWTSGTGWASLLRAALSQVLGHTFLRDSQHYCWATSSLWAEPLHWLQFGKQRSLLTPFDAPQILCALIVPTSCWQHLDTSAAIWHWRSRKCPAAVLREQSCLRFENKLRSTNKWCSSNP